MSDSLRTKMVDAMFITGASTLVLAFAGVAVTYVWDKVTTIDESIEAALAGVKATQQVTAAQISDLASDVQSVEVQVSELREMLLTYQQQALAMSIEPAAGMPMPNEADVVMASPPPRLEVASETEVEEKKEKAQVQQQWSRSKKFDIIEQYENAERQVKEEAKGAP